MNTKFSVKSALKYGFSTVIEKIKFFLVIDFFLFCSSIIACLLSIFFIAILAHIPFPEMVTNIVLSSNQELVFYLKKILSQYVAASILGLTVLSFLIVAYDLLYQYFLVGMVRIGLDVYDHQTSSYKRLFGPIFIVIKKLIASAVYGFLMAVGTFCFIIPGFIVAVRCSLYPQILVDKNCGIIESLKESWRITKGSFFKLFAIQCIFWLFNFLLFFTFGLVYLITVPAYYLTYAYVYRKLTV